MTAVLMNLAGLEVVAFDKPKPFTRRQLSDLQLAAAANDDGHPQIAHRLVATVEREIGVTERDRLRAREGSQAAERAAKAALKVRRDVRTRQAKEYRRRLSKSETAVKLSADLVQKVNEAEAFRARAVELCTAIVTQNGKVVSSPTAKDRKEAAVLRARAKILFRKVSDWKAGAEEVAEQNAITEAIRSQASARGEELITETVTAYVDVRMATEGVLSDVVVNRPMRVQRLRNVSRDGLSAAHDAGVIDRRQWVAGLAYRDLFEKVQERLGSQMGKVEGGGAEGPNYGSLGGISIDAVKQAKRSASLGARHDKIVIAVRNSAGERAVTMLKEVAGRGRLLKDVDGSERGHADLRLALEVAAKWQRI